MFIAILNPEPFGMECRGSEKELHMAFNNVQIAMRNVLLTPLPNFCPQGYS